MKKIIKSAINSNRVYKDSFSLDILDYPSVTQICSPYSNNGYIVDEVIIGAEVHDYISNYLLGNEVSEYDITIQDLGEKFIKNLSVVMRENDLSFLDKNTASVEVSKYITLDNDRGFAGTCDLLLQDKDKNILVVDFKTNKNIKDVNVLNFHKEQIHAYMELNNAVAGIVIYLEQVHFFGKDITIINKFYDKLFAYYEGLLKNGKIRQRISCDMLLIELANMLKAQNKLEEDIKSLKEEIISLAEEGKNFGNDEIEVFWKKESVRKTLKKDFLEKLKIENPHYFHDTVVNGGFSFKLKDVNNKES